MKLKQIIAGLMSAVMLLSSADIASFTSKAENIMPRQALSGINDDMEISSSNSFGGLVADKLTSEQQSEQEEKYDAEIFDVEVEGNVATISYNTTADCKAIIGILSEDQKTLLASGSAIVSSQMNEAEIKIETDNMPEYYYIKAYLVDEDTLAPVSKECADARHTKEMQELFKMTTDDFEPERVLNLDDDKTNNFAVYAEDTIVADSDDKHNTIVSTDDDNGIYVFDNADESIKSLEAGDKFSCIDDEFNAAIGIVDTVDIDGDRVTVTTADTDLEDIFECLKLDVENEDVEAEYGEPVFNEELFDTSEDIEASEEAATTVFGPVNKQKEIEAQIGGRKLKIDLYKIKSKREVFSASGSIELSVSANIEMYFNRKYQYVKCTIEVEFSMAATFKAKIKAPTSLLTVPLGFATPIPGLYFSIDPSIVFSMEGTATITGKCKAEYGFKFSSEDKFTMIKEPFKWDKCTISGKVELFWGFSLSPAIMLVSKKVAKVEAEILLGCEMEAVMTLYDSKDAGKQWEGNVHTCSKCVDMTFSGVFKASIELSFLRLPRLTYKRTFAKIKIGMAKYYYSFDRRQFGSGECPYNKKVYDLKVIDELNNPVDNATVIVKYNILQVSSNREVYERANTMKSIIINRMLYYYDPEGVKTYKDGSIPLQLSPGTYRIEVIKDGYISADKFIEVKSSDNHGTVVMKYAHGKPPVLTKPTTTKATTSTTTQTTTQTTPTEASTSVHLVPGTTTVNVPDGYNEADIKESQQYIDDCENSPVKPKLYLTVDGAVGGKVFDASSIAGKTITCSLDVSGANKEYLSTGIHVYYDSRLEIVPNKSGKPATSGAAIEKLSLGTPMIDLTAPEGMSGFFTSTAGITGREAEDGTMWTFQLKVPENAQPGDVYPIDIFYKDNGNTADCFCCYDDLVLNSPDNIRARLMSTYTFTYGIYNARYNPNFKADSHDIAYCPALADLPGYYDGYIAVAGEAASGNPAVDGKQYWVIFHEGYRDGRLEMSTFDAKPGFKVIWDTSLVCNEQTGTCNQYYSDNGKWEFIDTYGILTDHALDIVSCNFDIYVYDENGNLVLYSNKQVNDDDDDDIEYHLHKVSGRSPEAVRLNADYSEPELVTSEFTDLIPNAVYNFYYTLDKHIDGATAAFDADPDRLGFIAQGTADEDGNLSFTYYKPEGGENPAAYVVAAKKGISAAEVSIEDIPYDGKEHIIAPEVTLNGEALTEGVDYELLGDLTVTSPDGYTAVVRGIGRYFGEIYIGYAVVCEHDFVDGVCSICGHIDPEHYTLGDINGDGAVNSKDASEVLGEYSHLSTGDGNSLDYTQQLAADIDKNDSINSIDASNILSYYSYLSTGGKESFEQFLAPDKNTA